MESYKSQDKREARPKTEQPKERSHGAKCNLDGLQVSTGKKDKVAQNERSPTKYGRERRSDTDGWNEEDHEVFIEEAKKDEWKMSDNFLRKIQERLPYILHSEIIEHRKWVRGQYGSDSKERRTTAAKDEAKERKEN